MLVPKLFASSKARLTLNGAHLNAKGYEKLAPIFDRALFGSKNAVGQANLRLRAEIADKNFHWWHRYRAVNGYSIYGKRGRAGPVHDFTASKYEVEGLGGGGK